MALKCFALDLGILSRGYLDLTRAFRGPISSLLMPKEKHISNKINKSLMDVTVAQDQFPLIRQCLFVRFCFNILYFTL